MSYESYANSFTIGYKGQYIHGATINGIETIKAQIDFQVIPVKSIHAAKILITKDYDEKYIDKMIRHYLACALWTGVDDELIDNDMNYECDYDQLDDSVFDKAKADCTDFYKSAKRFIEADNINPEQCGHDFWLTRNRHGAGFWDRGFKHGEQLTALSHPYGEINLWINHDDEKVYSF